MSRERELMYKLDILRLQLQIACENGYELVQPRLESEIGRVERELSEARGFKPPCAGSEG
jgi:hypothetical protein